VFTDQHSTKRQTDNATRGGDHIISALAEVTIIHKLTRHNTIQTT